MHDADTIGDREGLLLIVRHQNCRRATRLQDLPDFVAQALAQFDIKAGKRLVHQQQRRPRGKRPGKRDALLLAAGQFMREAARRGVRPTRSSISCTRRARSDAATERSPNARCLRP